MSTWTACTAPIPVLYSSNILEILEWQVGSQFWSPASECSYRLYTSGCVSRSPKLLELFSVQRDRSALVVCCGAMTDCLPTGKTLELIDML